MTLQQTLLVQPPPTTSLYTGQISIVGNQFYNGLNGAGVPIQLRGANMSALEFVGTDQFSDVSNWGGVKPAWSVYQQYWKPNCCRIPLNAQSWLGQTCTVVASNTAFSSTVQSADPQSDYQSTVIQAVADANAAGCYVILDLHWDAPELTLGGVTAQPMTNTTFSQSAFANQTNSLNFWTSIANTFKNNPSVIYELFNEPFLDFDTGGSTLWGLMLNGGSFTRYQTISYNFATQTWNVAGYQQMLNAVRATGSTQICIINGPSFSQSIENYTNYFPTDSLSTPQLAHGWHPYPSGTYPYTNGNVYGKIGSDSGANTSSFSQWAQAVLNAGIPVIITEDGGSGGVGAIATPAEPHMAYMQSLADSMGMSYVCWQWNNVISPSNQFYGYISGTALTITFPVSGTASRYDDYCGTAGYQFQLSSGSGSNWTTSYSQTVGSSSSPVLFGQVTGNRCTTGTQSAPTALLGEGSTTQTWMVNHTP